MLRRKEFIRFSDIFSHTDTCTHHHRLYRTPFCIEIIDKIHLFGPVETIQTRIIQRILNRIMLLIYRIIFFQVTIYFSICISFLKIGICIGIFWKFDRRVIFFRVIERHLVIKTELSFPVSQVEITSDKVIPGMFHYTIRTVISNSQPITYSLVSPFRINIMFMYQRYP